MPDKEQLVKIEEVIDVADSFHVISAGRTRVLTRTEIGTAMGEHFKSRGFSGVSKGDE
jgi:hypothetical protein